MMKLPSFPLAEQDLLDQYLLAFEKVFTHSGILPSGSAKIEVRQQ